jgi:sulfur-oxidizing protein SoxX
VSCREGPRWRQPREGGEPVRTAPGERFGTGTAPGAHAQPAPAVRSNAPWVPDCAGLPAWCAGGIVAPLRPARVLFPLVLAAALLSPTAAQEALEPFSIVGDAIPLPLTGAKGDSARGRAIVTNRQAGLCLLCHSGPFPEQRLQGTLAPDLTGAGSRWSEGQLRLRIVDAARLNPSTIMPPYYRVDGLNRVAPAFRGKPVLSATQIEDVVAFLVTLRD